MRRIVVLLLAVLALAGVGGIPAPARAAAPAPPLDACLRAGSFLIQDDVCLYRRPRGGQQFGPISGITIVKAPRGQQISLTIPGGGDVGFGPQPGEVCGEFGCIRNGTVWRAGSLVQGLDFVSGCGPEDVTCTVVSNPPLVGDRGEVYQVVYGQVNHGINPTSQSMMWAFYTAPTIYPVELTPVDSSGARLALNHDVLAYAIREGTDPSAAACVDTFWFGSELAKPVPSVPDCVTFRRGGNIYTLEGTFEGWLPVDSGSWTIVADPAGNPAASLLSRPSGYQHTVVRPVGDDIATSILAERRPDLGIDITPRSDTLALGETQVVDVTVSAVGGETGSLDAITFSDPAVLIQGSDTPPLEILGIDPPLPDGGFRLLTGESRTFAVTVQAVSLGADGIGAAVTAEDDLGTPRGAAERGVTLLIEPGESGGPGAPEPPTITQARATDGAASGSLDGTVAGAPGEEVTVSLVTAPVGGDGTCLGQLEGSEVERLGSVRVTVGEDGVGRFAMDATLAPGHHVYGVTIADAGVSAIGPCTVVSEATPSVSIADAEVTEGTAKRGATALTIELTLSSPPIAPVSVRLAVADGTATAPADYTTTPAQVVTFPADQQTANVTIDVVPDNAAEDDETIRLTLSDPTGLRIATGMATATIVDDDGDAAATTGLDPRGTWTFEEAKPDPTATSTLEITDFDPQTGQWNGRVVTRLDPSVKFTQKASCFKGGLVCTLPASGTLRGDRFTVTVVQQGRTSKATGTLVRKKGLLTGLLSGKGFSGEAGRVRLTLTDPAP